jgi:hypothetical protein
MRSEMRRIKHERKARVRKRSMSEVEDVKLNAFINLLFPLRKRRFGVKSIFLLSFVFLFFFNLNAQIQTDEEPRRLYYHMTQRVKRVRDMRDMRDVCHLDKFLMGKRRISGNFSYNTGRVLMDDGIRKYPEYRSAIGYFTRIRFFEEFSFNTIFYTNFNKRANAKWVADFNYAIGRYNWRARRFNFGYENYINNKYNDDWKTLGEKFLQGYYFISYNQTPKKLNKLIRIDSTTSLRIIYFARYSLKYVDEKDVLHGGFITGKPSAGLAIRFTMFWNIYVEGAVYAYEPNKKMAWDPDYTYGLGYFDWRAFRLSLTYGNWAVNRFPWNKKTYPGYGFVDGNFRIVANWAW